MTFFNARSLAPAEPCSPAASLPHPWPPSRLSRQADHAGRAVRGGRPDRQDRPRPGRGPAQAAGADGGRRQHRRRRRHHRHGEGAARAAPDGYTLLVHHIGLATAPALYQKLGYKTEDLEFLGLINEAPSTLIGKQALPASQLRGAAQVHRRQCRQGQPGQRGHRLGVASVQPDVAERAEERHDFVPYKGTGPAMNDLLGGTVDLMCEQATNARRRSRARRSRPMA